MRYPVEIHPGTCLEERIETIMGNLAMVIPPPPPTHPPNQVEGREVVIRLGWGEDQCRGPKEELLTLPFKR